MGDMVVSWIGKKVKHSKKKMVDYREVTPRRCSVCSVVWGKLKYHNKPITMYVYKSKEHYICRECEAKRIKLKMTYPEFFEYDRSKNVMEYSA